MRILVFLCLCGWLAVADAAAQAAGAGEYTLGVGIAATATHLATHTTTPYLEKLGLNPAEIEALQSYANMLVLYGANRAGRWLRERAPRVPKSGVPQPARDVAGKVKSNMGEPPDGHIGGRVFKNAEGKLPQGGAYREYDVHPYSGANRGAERVVIDTKTGKAYYTNDHYQTFTEVPE